MRTEHGTDGRKIVIRAEVRSRGFREELLRMVGGGMSLVLVTNRQDLVIELRTHRLFVPLANRVVDEAVRYELTEVRLGRFVEYHERLNVLQGGEVPCMGALNAPWLAKLHLVVLSRSRVRMIGHARMVGLIFIDPVLDRLKLTRGWFGHEARDGENRCSSDSIR